MLLMYEESANSSRTRAHILQERRARDMVERDTHCYNGSLRKLLILRCNSVGGQLNGRV